MRLSKHLLRSVLLVAGLAVLTWICGGTGLMRAQAQYSDPVEDLKLTLKNISDPEPATSVELRRKLLTAAAAKLTTPSDLRQALGLLEWRDADTVYPGRAAVDRQVRQEIGARLEKIIQAAVAKGDPISKLAVASMLGEMGTNVRALDPVDKRGFARHQALFLIDLTKSEDPRVRQAAARALARIDPEPKAAVGALKGLLASADAEDRRAASEALGDFVKNVLELQKKGRSQTDITVSDFDVMMAADEVVPVTSLTFADKNPLVRRNGLQAIVDVTTALSELVPNPVKPEDLPPPLPPDGKWSERQLKDIRDLHMDLASEAKKFAFAQQALRDQGQNIANLLEDSDPQVRYLSRKALEQMANARNRIKRRVESIPALPGEDPPTKQYQDILKAGLEPGILQIAGYANDPNIMVRMATLQFLEAMEDAALPAIDTIIAALRDNNKFVRWSAARTLGKIGPDHHATKSVLALAALMNPQEDSDVRETTAAALRRYGAAAKPALPQMIKLLNVGEAEAQEAIIKAIVAIGGSETTAAIPAMIKSLDSRSAVVRKTAAEALGRMGPAASAAIGKLNERLQDEDQTVRIAVSDALLNIARPQ